MLLTSRLSRIVVVTVIVALAAVAGAVALPSVRNVLMSAIDGDAPDVVGAPVNDFAAIAAEPGIVRRVSLSFPGGLGRTGATLNAAGSVTLGKGVVLAGSLPGSGGVVGNAGDGTTRVGAMSVKEVTSLGNVVLAAKAHVGDLITAGRVTADNDSDISGLRSERATLQAQDRLDLEANYPIRTRGDVRVVAGRPRSLDPGAYATVVVPAGAELRLADGAYTMQTLDIRAGGTVVVSDEDGGPTVLVRDIFAFGGTVKSASAGAAAQWTVMPTGLLVSLTAPFTGALVAPAARVAFPKGSHSGWFYAADIDVAAGASITERGGSDVCLPDQPCFDVPAGASNDDPLPAPIAPVAPAARTGVLPATISVDNRGQAHGAVPLTVPPGPGGRQPKLSLEYSSSAGNGVAGIGWHVAGLSVISRCPRSTGTDPWAAPIADKGASAAVLAADRFCLDGNPLFAIGEGTYRTEIDSQVRVARLGDSAGNPDAWTVTSKDGVVRQYGNPAGGDFDARDGVAGATRQWYLYRESDLAGNQMTFFYQRACPVGECLGFAVVPWKIEYGEHAAPDSLTSDRSVVFGYEGRNDVIAGIERGSRRDTAVRLKTIRTFAGGIDQRTYQFTYQSDQNLSKLRAVQECALGTCAPGTTFRYLDDGQFSGEREQPGLSAVDSFGNGISKEAFFQGSTLVLDVNGDGFDDLLYPQPVGRRDNGGPDIAYHVSLSTGRTGDEGERQFQPPVATNLVADDGVLDVGGQLVHCLSQSNVVDWDGDGKDDIVDSCHRRVLLSTGSTYGTDSEASLADIVPQEFFGRRQWVGDLNGDGRFDLIVCQPDQTEAQLHYDLYTGRGPGGGFDPARTLPGFGPTCDHPPMAFDTNGDGVANLVQRQNDPTLDILEHRVPDFQVDWYALDLTATTAEWSPIGLTIDEVSPESHIPDEEDFISVFPGGSQPQSFTMASTFQQKTVDVNGDGLSDLVTFKADADGGRLRLKLNQGSTFVDGDNSGGAVDNPSVLPFVSRFSFYRSQVLDYNGDGRDDILLPTGRSDRADKLQWFLLRNTGRAFHAERVTDFALFDGSAPITGDFDGDGGSDLAMMGPGDDPVVKAAYTHSANSHRLAAVEDGVHRSTLISYNPFKFRGRPDERAFSRTGCGPANRQQVQCLRRPGVPLVSLLTEGQISDVPELETFTAKRMTAYSYVGAYTGMYQRGFLGFDQVHTDIYDESDTRVQFENTGYRPTTFMAAVEGTPVRRLYPFAGRETSHGVTYPRDDRAVETLSTDLRVKASADGLPMVFLGSTRTTELAINNGPPPTGPAQSVPLSKTEETFDVDGYGNEIRNDKTMTNAAGAQIAGGSVSRSFTPTQAEAAKFLVGLLKKEIITKTTPEESTARTTTHDYDATGLLHTSVVEPDDSSLRLTTVNTRHPLTGAVTESSVAGATEQRVTRTGYDSRGMFPVSKTDTGGFVTRTIYSPTGLLLVQSDPNGVVTRTGYDGFDREVVLEGPSGATRTTYDQTPFGPRSRVTITKETDGGKHAVTVADAFGRTINTSTRGIRGDEVLTESTYDYADRLLTESRPHVSGDRTQGKRTLTYDDVGRVTTETSANGQRLTHAYLRPVQVDQTGWNANTRRDALQARTTTNLAGEVSVEVTGESDRIVATVDRLGGLSQFTHSPFGDPRTSTDPAGNLTTDATDRLGRTTGRTDPDNGAMTHTVNAFGERTETRDARGGVQQTAYDSLGRPRLRVDSDGTVNRYTYDTAANGLGKPASSVRVGEATLTYGYEPFVPGRNRGLQASVSQQIGSSTHRVDYEYDQFGRQALIRYPDAGGSRLVVRNNYDDNGHLVGVADESTGTALWTLDAADQGYRVGEEHFGNGVSSTREYVPTLDRLSGLATRSGSTTLDSVRYRHTVDGNLQLRVDERDAAGSRWYNYDPLFRVTSVNQAQASDSATGGFVAGAQLVGYGYDPVGNLTTKSDIGTLGYNAPGSPQPHAVRSAGNDRYDYDASGRQITRTGPDVAGGREEISYTDHGLPRQVRIGRTRPSTVTYSYNTDGQRVRKAAADKTTTYVAGVFEEDRDSAGRTSYRNRVFADDREVVEVVRAGRSVTTSYLHSADLGSIELITGADGTVQQRQRFDPFGRTEAGVGPVGGTTGIRYGFTGHEQDDDNGLINMKGRIYDAATGRFLSPDPVLSDPYGSQGSNGYSYLANNPLNGTDSTGRERDVKFKSDRDVKLTPKIKIIGGVLKEQKITDADGRDAGKVSLGKGTFKFDPVNAGISGTVTGVDADINAKVTDNVGINVSGSALKGKASASITEGVKVEGVLYEAGVGVQAGPVKAKVLFGISFGASIGVDPEHPEKGLVFKGKWVSGMGGELEVNAGEVLDVVGDAINDKVDQLPPDDTISVDEALLQLEQAFDVH